MSELKRAHGMAKLRVRRMIRVVLQIALKTTACNIKRWLRAVLCGPKTTLDVILGALTWLLIVTVAEIDDDNAFAVAA